MSRGAGLEVLAASLQCQTGSGVFEKVGSDEYLPSLLYELCGVNVGWRVKRWVPELQEVLILSIL